MTPINEAIEEPSGLQLEIDDSTLQKGHQYKCLCLWIVFL